MIEIKFRLIKEYSDKRVLAGYERLNTSGYWEWMSPDITPDNGERWNIGVFPRGATYIRDPFIGLRDKKGNEIYKSDIIVHPRQDRPYSSKRKECLVKCVVEWYDGKSHGLNEDNPSKFNSNPTWIAKPINKDAPESRWGYAWSEFYDCEVIGNIHEHPNLICQQ